MTLTKTPTALSIAGSDSGGGAGIQADLKAFARCGVHGMTAITAITAQNTVGVSDIYHVPPDAVLAQIRAVVEDIGVDAIKIGMLGSRATVDVVAEALDLLPPTTPIVLDPVMVSETGARLLEADAEQALREQLLGRVTVVTPNIPEARVLVHQESGNDLDSGDEHEIETLARQLLELGPQVVVVTGGHSEACLDTFFDGDESVEISGEQYPVGASHGSGCTHSAALAACLALGMAPLEAAKRAKQLAGQAVGNGLRGLGGGPGPVDVISLNQYREAPVS